MDLFDSSSLSSPLLYFPLLSSPLLSSPLLSSLLYFRLLSSPLFSTFLSSPLFSSLLSSPLFTSLLFSTFLLFSSLLYTSSLYHPPSGSTPMHPRPLFSPSFLYFSWELYSVTKNRTEQNTTQHNRFYLQSYLIDFADYHNIAPIKETKQWFNCFMTRRSSSSKIARYNIRYCHDDLIIRSSW